MFLISSMLVNWPGLRSSSVRSASLTSPSGMFWFSVRRIWMTVRRQVERRDLLARQVDADLAAQAAVDGDRGDAGDALEARRQVVLRDLAQRHRIEVALDADAHDRHRGRVELEHRRRVGVFRQAAADAIEAGADFVGRLAQVGAPREVEAHVGVAFRGGRVDALEAGDGADRLLDRPRDELFHLERADAE